jgi:hypothetical protein
VALWGIGEKSSPDSQTPIFFEILCGLLFSSWPKASDEADGNTGGPQPGFFRITGKKYFVLYLRWLGEGNFVQILCGGSVIYTTDPAPAPVASKEPEKGKRYFGLYLLVGGLKPYAIWNPIYCKDSWRDYPLP